jgi:hypothetical protein
MNEVAKWNVIFPDVGEDGMGKQDGGCPVGNGGTKICKNIK